MKVAVCVKQIPDPADPGELNLETKTLKNRISEYLILKMINKDCHNLGNQNNKMKTIKIEKITKTWHLVFALFYVWPMNKLQ